MTTTIILQRQVEVAATLWSRVPSWSASDEALDLIATRIPENDPYSCFAKVVALDGLYSTFVQDTWAMAEHLSKTLQTMGGEIGPEIVDVMAAVSGKRHISFASKYAHFFIDSERFPIWDQYVLRSLAFHRGTRKIWASNYVEFFSWFRELEPLCEHKIQAKEMDRYLWLSGMYRQFKANKDWPLSKDAKKLFNDGGLEVVQNLPHC